MLDIEMHVLQRAGPHEFAALDFAFDLFQAALDRGEVGRGEDARRREHARVRQRAGDIGGSQAAVEVHRGVETLHTLGHRLAEAPRPAARG